jgi:hypothetical protein
MSPIDPALPVESLVEFAVGEAGLVLNVSRYVT